MNKKSTIMKQLINICKEFNLTLQELSNYVDELYERPENDLQTIHFKLYDTVEITLDDGEHIRAVVIDINDKEHKVTFVLENCFKDTSTMCDIDEFLASKYSMLPWSLMQIIEKHSFRLLTKDEVFGDNRYSYFYNIPNRKCRLGRKMFTWWLADASGDKRTTFYNVREDGSLGSWSAKIKFGVRPAFTIIQK